MFTEDLSVFFDPDVFGVPAVWGSLSEPVIFNAPGEDPLGGDVTGTDYTVLLAATAWPGIKHGDTVTVTGKGTFAVRGAPMPLDDGAIKRLSLSPI